MAVGLLALGFFITALLYSSVGFGGGSTYNALLILADLPVAVVPVLALVCNILVVAIGANRFRQVGALDFKRLWPLAIASVPAAWLGGFLHVPAWLFVGLLALCLLIAGLLMVWPRFWRDRPPRASPPSRWVDAAWGASLGLIAGVTGIGGGIYLSPVLHFRRWGSARLIAGTSAAFILVNSLGGLGGQLAKLGIGQGTDLLAAHWPLFPAVVAGGLIGSALGSRLIPERYLRILTGLLVLYVAVRLGLRFPDEWARR